MAVAVTSRSPCRNRPCNPATTRRQRIELNSSRLSESAFSASDMARSHSPLACQAMRPVDNNRFLRSLPPRLIRSVQALILASPLPSRADDLSSAVGRAPNPATGTFRKRQPEKARQRHCISNFQRKISVRSLKTSRAGMQASSRHEVTKKTGPESDAARIAAGMARHVPNAGGRVPTKKHSARLRQRRFPRS